MFPKARHQRNAFQNAYELLLNITPVPSKKYIHYQLMEDPDSNEMFFGADDSNFNGPWEVLLGKDVRIDLKVDLSKEEIVANCLLNTVLYRGGTPNSSIPISTLYVVNWNLKDFSILLEGILLCSEYLFLCIFPLLCSVKSICLCF